MGKFIWSVWGRLVALVAGVWQLWGALWAMFYRKYFWDFIGGKLGPTGIIAPGFAAPFIQLIVTMPIIQGVCAIQGVATVLLEWPLFPDSVFYRSLTFKIICHLFSAVTSALLYQTADASVIYTVAILAYIVALQKGEIVGQKAPQDSTA